MRHLALLFAILAIGFSVSAQNVQKDVDAIKKMETEINEGFGKNKVDAFNKYVHMNARIVTPDGNRTSRDAVSMMVTSGALKFTSSVISDLHVIVFIDTAIATYDTDDRGTYNSMSIDGKTRWTDTWARINDKWTCIASVASQIMEMPPPKK